MAPSDTGKWWQLIFLLSTCDNIVFKGCLVFWTRMLVILKLWCDYHKLTVDHVIAIESASLAELLVESIIVNDRSLFFTWR